MTRFTLDGRIDNSNVVYIQEYISEHASLEVATRGYDVQEHTLTDERIRFALEFGNLFSKQFYKERL